MKTPGGLDMYIYKRTKNKCNLIDCVNSNDDFTVEDRIIKLLRKDKNSKNVYDIKSKFTGFYTIYYFGSNFALIASEYLLNEDGTVKSDVKEVNS